mmetsp:Transcript_27243/g.80115  ORF Transcript_27243/g.80115 Transcript_27243/m.80115 type:complete len:368 (-) Transcript_27243:234-1337(-)
MMQRLTRSHLAATRWHAVLSRRRVLSLRGPDAQTFLQGLVTADVPAIGPGAPVHAAFLNRTGRVLFDAHLAASPDADGFLIDCDSGVSNALFKHLRKFHLRANVDLEDTEDRFVVVAFGGPDVVAAGASAPKAADGACLARDPRRAELGWRAIFPAESLGDQPCLAESDAVPDELYEVQRTLLGVAEGPLDLPSGDVLPLEHNLDLHRAISFKKGCYLGQELTARTHFTGKVRKRIVPVVRVADASASVEAAGGGSTDLPEALRHLPRWCHHPAAVHALAAPEDLPPAERPLGPPGMDVRVAGGDSLGKLRSVALGTFGLALLRLEKLHPQATLECAPAEEGAGEGGPSVLVRALSPPWAADAGSSG